MADYEVKIPIYDNKPLESESKSELESELESEPRPQPLTDETRAHNGQNIYSKILGISENRKYLVTYSKDDKSIVGWEIEEAVVNEEDVVKEKVVVNKKVEKIVPRSKIEGVDSISYMCVSNENILAFINRDKGK